MFKCLVVYLCVYVCVYVCMHANTRESLGKALPGILAKCTCMYAGTDMAVGGGAGGGKEHLGCDA